MSIGLLKASKVYISVKNSFNTQGLSITSPKTPWNQADVPLLLLLKCFRNRPRRQSEASQFGGSHKYKQNKTNKLLCFIDR
jgi:hypothetical protein